MASKRGNGNVYQLVNDTCASANYGVSRSRLFVLALEDFIQRQQSRELLMRINAAYADEPDPTEKALRRKARRHHRRIVEGT
ncbi:MAG: hypothetical protein FJ010_13315 [Chloroflexi bacterium]|nr:hypothetical protein [Chloroflexota bacterium]